MRKLIVPIVVSLFLYHTAHSQGDRREDSERLVITTFNTYFMWDGVNPEDGASNVNFKRKGDPQALKEHMEDIAAVIRELNPDIVNLVEVEDLAAVEMLNDEYLQGMNYKPYFAQGIDTKTGQDVALLTRVDPEGDTIARYDGKGNSNGLMKSVSKNYFARFTINGQKMALLSLHFLSNPQGSYVKYSRQAQADAIRDKAVELDRAGYSVVVLGDFNDYDGDMCCLDINEHRPITTVLTDIKNMDNTTNTDDLVNVSQFIDQEKRYTAHWDKNENEWVDGTEEYSAIDHILIAPELENLVDSAHIYQAYNPLLVSDHFPVTVALNLTKKQIKVSSIRMVSLVPNPSGNERENEKITLFNSGDVTVEINNWKFRDIANNTWVVNTTIEPGMEQEIMRNNQPMALNNSGDTIEMIDQDGNVVQTYTYSSADEDEVVMVMVQR